MRGRRPCAPTIRGAHEAADHWRRLTETAIVGSGVSGLSAALFLAREDD
jgi:ribulose 1,5-bisphosphate synthetase/thiazole synthase